MGFASALPTTVYAQDADVIDSYPREVLKQRAAKRKAEREAAAAAAASGTASELTPISEAAPAVAETSDEPAAAPTPVNETIRDDPAFVNETVPAHLQSATETAETETVSASAAFAPGPVVAGSSPMGLSLIHI